MAMAAKVENYCLRHCFGTKFISVEGSERACINCIWYDQYFHENRGNISGRVPTSFGYCILHREHRGALRQPCKDYETKESPARRGRQAAADGRAEV